MKTVLVKLFGAGALLLAAATAAFGQAKQNTNFFANALVPDNDLSGLASSRSFTSVITNITDLDLNLTIAGNFNGDLYGYVTHGTGFSVLLNRPGRTASNPAGYSDLGFNVKFDDAAANGDIHTYRAKLLGDPSAHLDSPVTGTWQPDARAVDPSVAVDTDARTAFLSAFNGLDANGTWTLFLADLSPGGSSTLISWGLEVTGIPEPGTWILFTLGGFGLLIASRTWRKH